MTDSPANILCKACGLCCSGHLFSWVRLNAPELGPVEKLGVQVIRDDPRQRGFLQPCPMWSGTCNIYDVPEYPKSCEKYKCVVLRRLLDEDITLSEGLVIVQETLSLIREIEQSLPGPSSISFRERLLAYKEQLEMQKSDLDAGGNAFLQKTRTLLTRYEELFGVDDFIDYGV